MTDMGDRVCLWGDIEEFGAFISFVHLKRFTPFQSAPFRELRPFKTHRFDNCEP